MAWVLGALPVVAQPTPLGALKKLSLQHSHDGL